MKKILILGASIAQVPFVKVARTLGCYVGIVDYDNTAAAIEFADEYFKGSLLDLDGLRKIVDIFQPNGITCGASDVGVENCSILCEENNLPGLSRQTAHLVKDKGAMIKAFEEHEVAHPKYVILEKNENYKTDIIFPVIVKPVDSSGSRGINVARNNDELKQAIEDSFSYSNIDRIIIEEYMDGPEVSVEILVQDGEPYILQVTDKLTTGEPHFIEIGHSQPSQLVKDDVKKIRELAYKAAKAVQIQDGCAHAEIKLTSKGPKMVEIAGRQGGDFITTILVPISTGINMSEYEILRAIGEPKKFKQEKLTQRGVAVRFIESKVGTVKRVTFDCLGNDMVGLEEMKLVCKSDVEYGEAKNNNDRFGYVVATGETPQIAIDRCNNIIEKINIEMK